MKTFIRTTSLLITIVGLFTLTAFEKDTEAKAETSAKAKSAQKLPRLLDLGAHKCIPCKMMAPILEELTKEYKGVFEVVFVDVWQPENKEIALAHKIKLIPTQIFFDANGKELWRHEGFISKDDILKKWKEFGFSFKPVQNVKTNPETAGEPDQCSVSGERRGK